MKKIKKILTVILLFIICLIFFSIHWALNAYDNLTFEEILYHLNPNVTKSSSTVINDYLLKGFLPALISTTIIIVFIKLFSKTLKKYEINIIIKIKAIKKEIITEINNTKLIIITKIIVVSLVVINLVISLEKIGLFDYIVMQTQTSTFIEENYVDPKKTKLTFPNKKRNLIYIFLESYESSFFTTNLGGLNKDNSFDSLIDLTSQNTNFSNSNKFGGAVQTYGVGWTSGGIVAQTAGIPLKIPGNVVNNDELTSYIKGAYTIGDILEKEGYNQTFLLGSKAEFGNKKLYFQSHGNYKIHDIKYAKRQKLISKNYKVGWGYEDSKLFKFAKEELLNLANQSKPFNLTLLTQNTHFPSGITEKKCDENYDIPYSNSIECSANQIKEFVEWIKQQSFYENTTIILSGDHLTMEADYINEPVESDKRTVYNLFINSAIKDKNSNNRNFTTIDMYPTTLAALGVTIKGDKLALGTNLYSKEKTLIEKYGKEKVDEELAKTSKFYNEKIKQ